MRHSSDRKNYSRKKHVVVGNNSYPSCFLRVFKIETLSVFARVGLRTELFTYNRMSCLEDFGCCKNRMIYMRPCFLLRQF